MRESEIERKLVSVVKNLGGICPKWVAPGLDGMPDRIVMFSEGRIGFIELKAPGKKARPLQLVRHGQLKKLGFKVYVLDSTDYIDEVLHEILSS